MRAIALLLLLSGSAHAALEDWSCRELAVLAGNTAVDRDQGVDMIERMRAVISAAASLQHDFGLDGEDARALVGLVAYVYSSALPPREVMREANLRCLRGERAVPVPTALPAGGKRV